MYDAGHDVVGVEVAEQAVQEFFTENNLEYTVEKLNKISGFLYKVHTYEFYTYWLIKFNEAALFGFPTNVLRTYMYVNNSVFIEPL